MLGPRTEPRTSSLVPRVRRPDGGDTTPRRQEEAYFIFNRYDKNKSGTIDASELADCLAELGYVTGRKKNADEMKTWVERQLKKADVDADGVVSRDDFIDYYNKYVAAARRQFSATYEVDKGSIGKGAFATVLRARRVGGGGFVAVKKIKKEGIELQLLHNEISIWERFDHPSLLKLLDVSETDEHLMLVTELMTGGDLHQALRAAGAFTPSEALALAHQIVSAVAYLHEHNVVHCDLKPSNILVVAPEEDRKKLRLKVADFGLSQMLVDETGAPSSPSKIRGGMRALSARALSAALDNRTPAEAQHNTPPVPAGKALGRLSAVCGTPEYFAPELVELAQGKASHDAQAGYNSSVDCWATGVMIFELLAGELPFYSPTEDILFYKISENNPDFSAPHFAQAPEAVRSALD